MALGQDHDARVEDARLLDGRLAAGGGMRCLQAIERAEGAAMHGVPPRLVVALVDGAELAARAAVPSIKAAMMVIPLTTL